MMLCQRVEEFRRETMLQNYNESFPELRYPQLHMAPSSEFNLVQPTEQPWYNYHNGLHNGGGEYYSSRTDNKTPSEWNSYHSDNESPFISSQMNNNSCESQYSNGMHSIVPVESPLMPMVNSDSLTVNGSNALIHNGVDSRLMDCPITPKEEDTLPKIDGPKPSTNASCDSLPKDGSRDALKLPGFHQTFGNITEIGRFSQHDDYFEATPAHESVEAPKISDEITDPTPKRKPRGRKRKQPEPRELFTRHQTFAPTEHAPQVASDLHWSYPHGHHPQSSHYDPYHQQWRSHPQHPYYQQHHFHHHHHYPPPAPPPPINPYYQPYNDCPPPYHYNSYPSNWHMSRDYMPHNYQNYV